MIHAAKVSLQLQGGKDKKSLNQKANMVILQTITASAYLYF